MVVLSFGHLYQKIKIVILAYQISSKQLQLDNLGEERSDLVYNFYKEANLVSINKRVVQEGLGLNYPREYVKVTPTRIVEVEESRPESLLAKVLGLTSRVEAQP